MYRELADGAVEFLLAHVAEGEDGAWYWNYRLDEAAPGYPQDLVHAGYTAWGLLKYMRNGGRYSALIPWGRLASVFNRYEGSREFALTRFAGGGETARLWDVAFLLAVLTSSEGEVNLVKRVFRWAMGLRTRDGQFHFAYDDPNVYVRAEAAMLLGLSEYVCYLSR
jgi:hypothetical protein